MRVWLGVIGILLFAGVAWAGGNVPDELLAKVKYAMTANKVVATGEPGTGRTEFKETAPDAGVLVGVHVTYTKFMDLNIIGSVQPIFMTAAGTVGGSTHGFAKGKSGGCVARDGYAVGGITIRAGMFVNGFQCTFMKMESWGLNPKDSYNSEWMGAETGGSVSQLGGDGSLVVGICGKTNDDAKRDRVQACSLGLLLVPGKSATATKRPGSR